MKSLWIGSAGALACLAYLMPLSGADAQSASPTLESKIETLLDLLEDRPASPGNVDQPAVSAMTTVKAKIKIEEASKSACDRFAVVGWNVDDNNGDYLGGAASKLLKCKNGTCKTTIRLHVYVEDANLANQIRVEPRILPSCGDAFFFEVPPANTQFISIPDVKIPQGGSQTVKFKSKI